MKYFTQEWASGVLPDEEWQNIPLKYEQHLHSILDRLPESIKELANNTNLHDGLIRRILVNRKNKTIAIELRCGDLQCGYFDIDMEYSGVNFETADLVNLAKIARDRNTELLYDEVDIGENGNYVHRILFHPLNEISIIFSTLKTIKTSKPDRSFPLGRDPYKEE